MGLASSICYHLARRRALGEKRGGSGHNPASFDQGSYVSWRTDQLETQLRQTVDTRQLTGRDVLDFGCGQGDLTFLLAQLPLQSLTALDVSEDRVLEARRRASELDLPLEPLILQSQRMDAIDLPDESMDHILCFDVLEHVMEWRKIVCEWRRLLRRHGRIHIWWVPWWNPWGHHIESLVPIPWAHLLFPEHALVQTCARIYDDEAFEPRYWDLDQDGNKKPNKWRTLDQLPEVNRLTIQRFEKFVGAAGLRIDRRHLHGFGGSPLARATRPLLRIPVLGEFFASYVTYELVRA